MAWSYDLSDLDTSTDGGRLNVVRFLLGDTDTTNQLLQDEELQFSLSQTGDNVYSAAAYSALTLSGKYASKVDVELDGALSAKYSQLSDRYYKLHSSLDQQGKKYSGKNLGVSSGGIKHSQIDAARSNDNRVDSEFRRERFVYGED